MRCRWRKTNKASFLPYFLNSFFLKHSLNMFFNRFFTVAAAVLSVGLAQAAPLLATDPGKQLPLYKEM